MTQEPELLRTIEKVEFRRVAALLHGLALVDVTDWVACYAFVRMKKGYGAALGLTVVVAAEGFEDVHEPVRAQVS